LFFCGFFSSSPSPFLEKRSQGVTARRGKRISVVVVWVISQEPFLVESHPHEIDREAKSEGTKPSDA